VYQAEKAFHSLKAQSLSLANSQEKLYILRIHKHC
jgi:hypothetical protein